MTSQFDEVLPRAQLSTAKWEMEIARTGDQDLLCFGTADMDFKSPPSVVDALRQVVELGHFGYPFKSDAYYDAITHHFDRRLGWQVRREWLSSNVGVYASMHTLIDELSSPGDEVVYQTPVHHVFREVISSNGRSPVENPLVLDQGTYRMDLAALADIVTERTRLFVLCNPHNPVGRVWTHAELSELSEFCVSRGIRVLADEVYFGLINKGVSFTPMASVSPEASLNTVTITAASKSFNLTGLKHSLVIAENSDLLQAYNNGLRKNNLFYGGSTMGIIATQAALDHGDTWLDELMAYVATNFNTLAGRLGDRSHGILLNQPEATYFAWLDCRAWELTDADLIEFFEKDARIIVSAGRALGTGGEGHVRINLACPRTTLSAGLDRLDEAIGRRFGS